MTIEQSESPVNHAEIAVIIVNYGTAGLAVEAVVSVLNQTTCRRVVEIHLVDNASPGQDIEKLYAAASEQSWGDRVTIYPEKTNHGFGRGNNVVLRKLATSGAPPDKIFVLNPDARLEGECLEHLAADLDDRNDVGAVGPKIVRPDGQAAVAAFQFPSLLSDLESTINFGPVSRLLRPWAVSMGEDCPFGPVDWVSGAAVMFRFEAIAHVDFFDSDFFLYFEEVDLMRRLSETGWKCLHDPHALVSHVEGAATNVRGNASVRRTRPAYLYESYRLYRLKAWGRMRAIFGSLLVLSAAVVNHAINLVRRRQCSLPLNFLQDHTRLVLIPLLTGRRVNDRGDPCD